MQLLTAHPAMLAETLVSNPQLQTSDLPAHASTQRPKLSMVWQKEFDGKHERMVAHWVVEPFS
jgi:hypothetical protein